MWPETPVWRGGKEAGYLGNGATGYYATASLHATNPCYAVYTSFTSDSVVGDNNIYRYYGLTIRPVAD